MGLLVIGSGSPCCRAEICRVGWRAQNIEWSDLPTRISGVVHLDLSRQSGDYRIFRATSSCEEYRRTATDPWDGTWETETTNWVNQLLARVHPIDPDDLMVAWYEDRFPNYESRSSPVRDIEWDDFEAGSGVIGGFGSFSVWKKEGGVWQAVQRPGLWHEFADVMPVDFWRFDAMGQVYGGGEFPLTRHDLLGGQLRMTIEWDGQQFEQILDFHSVTPLPAVGLNMTQYLFRHESEHTLPHPHDAEFGPQPELVEALIVLSGCGAPIYAAVGVRSPVVCSWAGPGAVLEFTYASAVWAPATQWAEFAYTGTLPSVYGLFGESWNAPYPLSLNGNVSPPRRVERVSTDPFGSVGTRGLNWAGKGIATYDVARVVGLDKL